MLIEVLGEDLNKQLLHIHKNFPKGSKLTIEVYEDVMLLVYKDMEYPVRIFQLLSADRKLILKYELKRYILFYKIIKKYSKEPTYKLDFQQDYFVLNIGKTSYILK